MFLGERKTSDRTSEALDTINDAEALAERIEVRGMFSRLHRLRDVFLATVGAEESEFEASFCEAIRIAREQKPVSLLKRAEGTPWVRCKSGVSQVATGVVLGEPGFA
jgi:hypothetical protein